MQKLSALYPFRPKVLISGMLLLLSVCTAENYETGSLSSELIGRDVSYIVFLPQNYHARAAQGEQFPVLYWLHCYGCDLQDYYAYPSYCPPLDSVTRTVDYIMVAPLDDYGWWLDSPEDPSSKWSSFLIEEFKPHIDSTYRTLPDRKNTGIVGHSMGGFGAFHNAIEHPEVFGVVFSIKGGLDPRLPLNPNWPQDFSFRALLGTSDTSRWDAVNVLKNAHRLRNADITIGFCAGENDGWFRDENDEMHRVLDSMEIDHLYWKNGEGHGWISSQSMAVISHFFDTAFVYTEQSGVVSPRVVPPARGTTKVPNKARVRLDGRRVDISWGNKADRDPVSDALLLDTK